MIFLAIFCVLLLGTTVYCGYRAYYLAGLLADAQEYIEDLETTNVYMFSKIGESYENMQNIDRLGAFEAEDEAGTTFALLKETITELKDIFDGEAQEKK
ncbi:hypothetical protein UFOVP1307_35 [uncultured Caudovirales phage]|uniref:Uncharacterized protein n=1 Tax=uncultured Caudovirales phage TaxID=2100421 RepID=A0A6J5PNV4_9CAUD|nr:hypothetical protein UFOVP651_87 [uncultured Caudovirales phage]CAB4171011.1 hypothetical protein UFOVP902_166 [uncultured Caudovirales phage]CAB4197859.1 hypothetical protein UFOVP1307_35 [uncultured Caudovirales phage]